MQTPADSLLSDTRASELMGEECFIYVGLEPSSSLRSDRQLKHIENIFRHILKIHLETVLLKRANSDSV